jgi:polar amino acid transport system substrate-binding protein
MKRAFINKKVSNILLTIFIVTTFMISLCSCKNETIIDDDDNRSVITIGSNDYPPFMDLDNNGNPTGIDVDILKEAFDRIGYDIQFVTISWENKDDLLKSKDIDCVTGGFTINGRENDYLWIGPYMNSNQVIVVNKGSGIDSLNDLNGKTIAVQSSGTAEKILLERSISNIPEDIQILSYEDNMLIFAALNSNYIDAFVADEPVIVQYMKDYETNFVILDEPLINASVGTAFALDGDVQLCKKANDAIDEMKKDGTLQEIIENYLDDASRYIEGDE